MWQQIKLPYIFERMIGFSIPNSSQVLVISYEGIHQIQVANSNAVIHNDTTTPEGGHLYDWKNQQLRYDKKDHAILGLHGGNPIYYNPQGEELVLNENQSEFMVLNPQKEQSFHHKYVNFPGDWAAITFSQDGNLIALGMPYDLYLFERNDSVTGNLK
jgi:hypothetical protein